MTTLTVNYRIEMDALFQGRWMTEFRHKEFTKDWATEPGPDHEELMSLAKSWIDRDNIEPHQADFKIIMWADIDGRTLGLTRKVTGNMLFDLKHGGPEAFCRIMNEEFADGIRQVRPIMRDTPTY